MSTTEIDIVKSLNSSNFNTIVFYNIISILCSIIITGLCVIIFDRTIMFITLFIITLLTCLLLKITIRRERPYKKCCNIKNNDITHTNENYSFPSLHVAGITVLSLMLWDIYNFPYLFYIMIPLCMISRIGLGVHYFSDCIAGFSIPTFIYLFMKLQNTKNV